MNRTQQNLATLYMISRTQQNSAVRWTELNGTWHGLTTWLAGLRTNLQKNIEKTAENMWIIGKTRQSIHGCKMSRTQQNLAALNYMLSRTQQNSAARRAELSGTWQDLTTWLAEPANKLSKTWYTVNITLKKSTENKWIIGQSSAVHNYMVAISTGLSKT